jgi:hypothetical protein
MKIKTNKEKNINENSKMALNDFTKKQISMNILYHKVFLGMCIIVNIGLIIFIFVYRNQLEEIELLSKKYTREFSKNDHFINEQRSTIDHKLVNLISNCKSKNLYFAYSFKNKTEFDLVQNFINGYYKNDPYNHFIDYINLFERHNLLMTYQSTFEYERFFDYKDVLRYQKYSLIIINTEDDKRFGIYIDEPIIFDEKNEFVSKENRFFIFSFQSKTMHKYIGKGSGLKMNNINIIEIGDDDIVIYENFYNNGGYINYPLKDFENLDYKENIFTGKNGKFDIKNIEIFGIF